MNTQQPQMSIDFANTTPIEGFDGGHLFGQAFIMRKVSKFVVGGTEDALLPIPVFYCLDSKKIQCMNVEVMFVMMMSMMKCLKKDYGGLL